MGLGQVTGVSVIVRVVAVHQESLAEVVGRNCKRIRTEIGITQDELARYARPLGLRWSASSVGDFEAGRSAPTLATVFTVGVALQFAARHAVTLARLYGRTQPHDRAVTLADLLGGDGLVALTDALAASAADLAGVCRGGSFRFPWYEPVTESTAGLAEQRLAKRLGIEPDRLADVSNRLWGCMFSEERDRRAGPDSNQQKRGQVSRTLRAELEKALADGNDQ